MDETPSEKDFNKAIMAALSADMPKEAIQKTLKADTKKGYDTIGYGYAYVVNRFNDVLGIDGWGFTYDIVKESSGTFGSGKPYQEVTVAVRIWVLNPDNGRMCVGGHISATYADALKGAITNAFKKTAAFWGVGKQAYEGSLDDDASYPEHVDDRVSEKRTEKKTLTGELEEVMTAVEKVTLKEGEDAHGNPSKRYTVWAGDSYYTFSETFATAAKTASTAGKFVNIKFVRNKWGSEIKDLTVLERHV